MKHIKHLAWILISHIANSKTPYYMMEIPYVHEDH